MLIRSKANSIYQENVIWNYSAQCGKVKVAQSCLTLCVSDSLRTHGRIFQARILEWVAFSFSRGSSQPRDQIQVSRIAGGFFTSWATREALAICDYRAFEMCYDILPGLPRLCNKRMQNIFFFFYSGYILQWYLYTGLNKYIKSTFICLVLLLKFKVLSVAHIIFDGKQWSGISHIWVCLLRKEILHSTERDGFLNV